MTCTRSQRYYLAPVFLMAICGGLFAQDTNPGASGTRSPESATALYRLAVTAYQQGRYVEAETLARRALAIRQLAAGADHPAVAEYQNNLAVMLTALGRYREAETLYLQALALLREALGPKHPSAILALGNLGDLYHAQGRYAEAESAYERALALEESVTGVERRSVAIAVARLAEIAALRREYDKSERLVRRALAILESQPAGALDEARVLNTFGHLRWLQRDYEQAAQYYRRALVIFEHLLGPEHFEVAATLFNLARAYCGTNNWAEAEPLLQRALKIKQAALGNASPELGTILRIYSDVLRKLHRKTEAAQLEARARAITDPKSN